MNVKTIVFPTIALPIAFAAVFALTSTVAFARGHHHRHHQYMHYSGNCKTNGTAGGPTTLSGTGPSTFGGKKRRPGR